MVICDIDSICRLLKDYCGMVGVPPDAIPIKLLLNPTNHKLGILMESSEWTIPQPPEDVKFVLQSIYSVGG